MKYYANNLLIKNSNQYLGRQLVQMPTPVAGFHTGNTPLLDLRREHRAKPIPQKANGFVAHIDATFVKQILHVAKREGEPDVQHYRKADDLRTGFEIAKWGTF